MTNIEEIVAALTSFVRLMVDKPELVRVETFEEGAEVLLRLHVDPSDVGRFIGAQGRTARSFRTLLGAAGMNGKRKISLDIVEQE